MMLNSPTANGLCETAQRFVWCKTAAKVICNRFAVSEAKKKAGFARFFVLCYFRSSLGSSFNSFSFLVRAVSDALTTTAAHSFTSSSLLN